MLVIFYLQNRFTRNVRFIFALNSTHGWHQ